MTDPTSVKPGFYWVKIFDNPEWDIVKVSYDDIGDYNVIIGMGNSDFPVEPRFITTWGPKIETPNS